MLQELIATVEIDVPPGDGRYVFDCVSASHIAGSLLMFQEPGKNGGVVKNDAVGNQAAAFRPEILLILGFEAKLAEAGEGDGTTQLMIVLAPVQRLLDMLAQ